MVHVQLDREQYVRVTTGGESGTLLLRWHFFSAAPFGLEYIQLLHMERADVTCQSKKNVIIE